MATKDYVQRIKKPRQKKQSKTTKNKQQPASRHPWAIGAVFLVAGLGYFTFNFSASSQSTSTSEEQFQDNIASIEINTLPTSEQNFAALSNTTESASSAHQEQHLELLDGVTVSPTEAKTSALTEAQNNVPPVPQEKWSYIKELENKTVPVKDNPQVVSSRPYLMQCGAYKAMEHAEKRKALIAFQGLESEIRVRGGESGNWYSVVLGPYEFKRKAESDRNMLRKAGIEPCAIWYW